MSAERKHYLDNLRSITVIMVIIYHCAYVFNGVGVLGGFSKNEGLWLTDGFITLIYPWFMVLMFCISGIAARHSIDKRGTKRFISERTKKLLIPSTLGLFVFHWISGYLNIKNGGALEQMPSFLIYPISVLSGTGPLWFAQLLYLYCIIAGLFVKLNGGRFDSLCKRTNEIVILLLAVVIWGGSQILNMPVIVVYRFGIYFVAFAIGYFVLYHDEVMAKVEKMLPFTSLLSVIFGLIYMNKYYGGNYTESSVLKSLITNVYLWMTIITILGVGKRYLNKTNKVFKYLHRNSFGYYVLHYFTIMIVGYLLNYHTALSGPVCILITLIFDLVMTPILNFVIAKIPIIRYCVLGIKGDKNEIQVDN